MNRYHVHAWRTVASFVKKNLSCADAVSLAQRLALEGWGVEIIHAETGAELTVTVQ